MLVPKSLIYSQLRNSRMSAAIASMYLITRFGETTYVPTLRFDFNWLFCVL